MRLIVSIAIVAFISCCSQKTSTNITADNTTVNAGEEKNVLPGVSVCINRLIDSFKTEDRQNPPRSIYSYTYHDKMVYYVPPICCDFFSDLLDSNCNLIGHPDGGFTGRGDLKMPDFRTERTNEKLIWHDNRK